MAGERRFVVTRDDDRIEVTIAPDGLTRIDVQGEVSWANHGSAEEAVAQVEKMLGGATKTERSGHAVQEHAHGHAHTHKA